MTERPYHKYVFDTKKRRFVGKFEEMYKNEDNNNCDSWFQDDTTYFTKASLLLLSRYNFANILDIGCGKGAFTHLLKKDNNNVLGTDIAVSAVKKAAAKYPGIVFRPMTAEAALKLDNKWDLIVMLEVLSYLKNWRHIINLAASKSKFLYICLYIPSNPIGYVKRANDLRREMAKMYDIKHELIWNNEHIMILGKTKEGGK
ncbi:MAG: methyltransferase [Smithella sp.]|nr:methyltransferase [Smithella sp.]